MADPRLRKAARITGRRLSMRDATEGDAAFIHSLRTDEDKSQHLSAVSDRLEDQVAWLRRYAHDDRQAYFILEDGDGPAGTVRLYDARGASFCWGSWIIRSGAPASHAFESALMVYHYALSLGFTAAHFDVRRANQSVWRFHERFGAVRVGETADDFLYTVDHAAILASLARYARYLPDGITVS
jgi:RimJ/RimL family protein N-acetyltransferase